MSEPTTEAQGTGPKHSRLLPSFAVQFVTRPLTCTIGAVEPRELLAWNRSSLPSAATARDLREVFVKARRNRFGPIWDSPVNVRIPEDWRRALDDTERLRLLPIISREGAADKFPQLTLRELRSALRLPVADALGILAKIEAIYWIPKLGQLPRRRMGALEAPPADVHMEPDVAAQLHACLALKWVTELSPADLRFPHIEGQPPGSWLQAQAQKPVLSGNAHHLCQRLLEADQATWAQELADLAAAAVDGAHPRPGSAEARERWIAIFLARYGGARGLELQGVGDQFGITRERVRQICDATLASLRAQPAKAPALERLLSAAARVLPLSADDADVQLGRFLGEGAGIKAAVQFAELLGLQSPIRVALPMARTSAGYRPVPILEAAAAPAAAWMEAALTHARRDCTMLGCTNYVRIAGLLALEQGTAQDLDTLSGLFSMSPGYRLLDPTSGWFTLADSEHSAAAARVRKLLSVVEGSTGVDTIASALMTDDRWLYREAGRALALPPLHVLVELIGGWDWISANRHNKFTAKTPIDKAQVLSKAELATLEAIQALGGVATRAQVAEHLIGTMGMSNMSVSFVLASCSAFHKIEHAIYGVRGQDLPLEALIAARARRRLEQLTNGPVPAGPITEVDHSQPLRIIVSQSGSTVDARKRVVYLPAYFAGKIEGQFSHAGGQWCPITVGSMRQIRYLSQVAETLGVGPGEKFAIVFDVQRRTYEIPKDGAIESEADVDFREGSMPGPTERDAR